MTGLLDRCRASLTHGQPWKWTGQVIQSVGSTIESTGPVAAVGECCEIVDRFGVPHPAEVIGFRGSTVLSMPVEGADGIRFRDSVAALGVYPEIAVGPGLMGRVLNAAGHPIDDLNPLRTEQSLRLEGAVRSPLDRVAIRTPLGSGIRVLDGLLTVGRGQRVGIFGGSGVGKSTLIGMMTRNTAADVTVVGLVGERPRGGRVSRRISWRRGPRALGGCGIHFGPVAIAAPARRAGRDNGGGVLCSLRKTCASGSRLAHPVRHGGARDWPGCR